MMMLGNLKVNLKFKDTGEDWEEEIIELEREDWYHEGQRVTDDQWRMMKDVASSLLIQLFEESLDHFDEMFYDEYYAAWENRDK